MPEELERLLVDARHIRNGGGPTWAAHARVGRLFGFTSGARSKVDQDKNIVDRLHKRLKKPKEQKLDDEQLAPFCMFGVPATEQRAIRYGVAALGGTSSDADAVVKCFTRRLSEQHRSAVPRAPDAVEELGQPSCVLLAAAERAHVGEETRAQESRRQANRASWRAGEPHQPRARGRSGFQERQRKPWRAATSQPSLRGRWGAWPVLSSR